MNIKRSLLILWVCLIWLSIPALAWEKIISIPYYSTPVASPNWTGPASAGMILQSPIITAHPSYVAKTQTELWTFINTHSNSAWNPLYPGVHTDPEAMRECLKQFDSRPAFTYVIYQTSTYNPIVSQKIVQTLANYDVPPAVPIDGGLNWVAVFGVNTSADPSSGTYSINWFLINDPRDPVLGNNRIISYLNWENNGASSVFRHIATPEPFPNNLRKLAVCDPEIPGELRIQAPEIPVRRAKVLSPVQARNAALEALEKFNLLDMPGFHRAPEQVESGRPILVRRTSGNVRADYYIVPMVKKGFLSRQKLTGAILIDAYSGAFLETSVTEEPIHYPYLTLSVRQIKQVLTTKVKRLERVNYEELNVETPVLVWRPGLSVNPYFPLWKVRTSIKGVVQVRYMDMNKNVHSLIKRELIER